MMALGRPASYPRSVPENLGVGEFPMLWHSRTHATGNRLVAAELRSLLPTRNR